MMAIVDWFSRNSSANIVIGLVTGFFVGHVMLVTHRLPLELIHGGIRAGFSWLKTGRNGRYENSINALQLNVTSKNQVF
jgi:hypothetical protein